MTSIQHNKPPPYFISADSSVLLTGGGAGDTGAGGSGLGLLLLLLEWEPDLGGELSFLTLESNFLLGGVRSLSESLEWESDRSRLFLVWNRSLLLELDLLRLRLRE